MESLQFKAITTVHREFLSHLLMSLPAASSNASHDDGLLAIFANLCSSLLLHFRLIMIIMIIMIITALDLIRGRVRVTEFLLRLDIISYSLLEDFRSLKFLHHPLVQQLYFYFSLILPLSHTHIER